MKALTPRGGFGNNSTVAIELLTQADIIVANPVPKLIILVIGMVTMRRNFI